VLCRPYQAQLVDLCTAIIATHRTNRILIHIVTIFVKSDHTPSGSAAGSGCLVKLPKRTVILTAEHVARDIASGASIAGNGPRVDITSWPIIGIDPDVDIATIGVPELRASSPAHR
jgi:hypothetical protein